LAIWSEVVGPYRMGLSGRIVIDVRVSPGLPLVSVDRTLLSQRHDERD
jgi:hypothetical protein